MARLLTLSRAAHLLGMSRAALQARVREGALPACDGQIAEEDLLRLYPQLPIEEAGVFEKVAAIRDDAFAKRLRERVLPSQEVLARRLFAQGQELAELRRHLTRYHALLCELRELAGRLPPPAADELLHRFDEGLAAVLASPPASGSALEAMEAALRVMSAHVTVRPSGHEFFVEGAETLLKAALRAGLAPGYGCGSGSCGLCKARVVAGEVRQVAPADYVFTAAEKAQGYALMCACTAQSADVVVEMLEAAGPADIPEQQIVARVRAIDPLGAAVWRLHVQTPRSNRLRFLAGQRVSLGLAGSSGAGDVHGEYAIASCPCDDRNLIFHIPREETREASAAFAQRLFGGGLRVGDELSVWGPWGDFVLTHDTPRPLVFAAVETGFAPINSLIEHAIAADEVASMALLWAVRRADGHYLPGQCRAWAAALDGFDYRPLLAIEPGAALGQALMGLPQIAQADIYLCGPPADIALAATALAASGVAPERLRQMAY